MIFNLNDFCLSDDHYLRIAKDKNELYLKELKEAIDNLSRVLPTAKLNRLKDKLMIGKHEFKEDKFIQSACEIAVANYFSGKDGFDIEKKVNPYNNTDVDCQFTSNGIVYNIEVKCSSYDKRLTKPQKDDFVFQSIGRLNKSFEVFEEIKKILNDGLDKSGNDRKGAFHPKKMDNVLKDFLISANNKFNPDLNENEVNILLVGCDDSNDIQEWFHYLFASQGLFTSESFTDNKLYSSVDLVVLTNLYFKHKDFYKKQSKGFWSLTDTFNLYFENPSKKHTKRRAIDSFYFEFLNYNSAFNSYSPAGNTPDDIRDSFRILHFIKDYLEKENGIYLFNRPSKF